MILQWLLHRVERSDGPQLRSVEAVESAQMPCRWVCSTPGVWKSATCNAADAMKYSHCFELVGSPMAPFGTQLVTRKLSMSSMASCWRVHVLYSLIRGHLGCEYWVVMMTSSAFRGLFGPKRHSAGLLAACTSARSRRCPGTLYCSRFVRQGKHIKAQRERWPGWRRKQSCAHGCAALSFPAIKAHAAASPLATWRRTAKTSPARADAVFYIYDTTLTRARAVESS